MANPTLDRLEAVTAQLEKLASQMARSGGGAGGGDDAKLAPSVEAWNDYYTDCVQPFVNAAKKLNLADIVKLTEQGWKNVGELITVAPSSKKPSNADLQKFVKPASDAIGQASGLTSQGNHEKAYAEVVMALGWVMSPKPMPHIQGQLEAADFYLTKVLTSNKDATNKEDHRAFVKLAKEMLKEMKEFVKQWYRTGLEYKGQGSIFDKPSGGAAAGGAPAPPPIAAVPPPAAAAAPAPSASSGGSSGAGFGAVLASINKGSAITSGLKKVTSDMKTKNRKERPGLVKAAPKPAASGASKWSQKQQVDRPPAIRFERGTHYIEYQKEGQCAVPDSATIKDGVFIHKCAEAFIDVPKKVKAVVLDGCKKTRVRVHSVVSTVEIINCDSVKIELVDMVNSVAIDKTNGCQVFVNNKIVNDIEFITSNISEVNISVPGDSEDDDRVEMPVPEQFKTLIKGKGKATKLATESVKHG